MKKLLLSLTLGLLVFGVSNAQIDTEAATHQVSITIPSINLVDVEDASGSNAGTLAWTLDASALVTEAGDFNTEIVNNDIFYLQYTSVVTTSDTRKITAELSASSLSSALELQLKTDAKAKTTSKKGKTGNGNGEYQALSESAQEIVAGIKTAYTGTAAQDGHALNYKLVINPDDSDFENLGTEAYEVTITYTITE